MLPIKLLLLATVLLLSGPGAFAQISPVVQKADSLLAKGLASEALEGYKAEHRRDPKNPFLFAKMAAAAAGKGKYMAALLWYDSALVAGDPPEKIHIGKAKAYYELEQWEDVVRESSMALSWQGRPRYYGLRGCAHRRLGHAQDAWSDLARAVGDGNREPAVLVEYAELLRDSSRLEEALQLATRAVQAAPRFWRGYVTRATIRLCLLRPDSICADMAAAQEAGYQGEADIPPALCDGDDSLRLIIEAEYCSRHRQYGQAIKVYSQLVAQHGVSSLYLVNRANCYAALHQERQAAADYRAAEKSLREADRRLLYHNMGRFYDGQGKPETALVYMKKEMALMAPDPEAYLMRSKLFLQLNRMAEALADLDSAVLLAPGNKSALALRGAVHLELKQYPEAEADARRLLETASSTGIGQCLLGLSLLKQNKPGYCDYFKTAVELGLEQAVLLVRRHCP